MNSAFLKPSNGILFLFLGLGGSSQEMIRWNGYRIDGTDTVSVSFELEKKDSVLKGKARYFYKPNYYKILTLSGKISGKGDSIILSDGFIEDKLMPGPACNTYGIYYLSSTPDSSFISGVWKEPGKPSLRKQETARLILVPYRGQETVNNTDSLLFRKLVSERRDSILQVIRTGVRQINIKVYDHAVIDNDRITIFLNDEILVKNHRITATPLKLALTVEDKKTPVYLRFVAENEGKIPPNTAYIDIQTAEGHYSLMIPSSYKYNGVIVFQLFHE